MISKSGIGQLLINSFNRTTFDKSTKDFSSIHGIKRLEGNPDNYEYRLAALCNNTNRVKAYVIVVQDKVPPTSPETEHSLAIPFIISLPKPCYAERIIFHTAYTEYRCQIQGIIDENNTSIEAQYGFYDVAFFSQKQTDILSDALNKTLFLQHD